MTTLEFLQFILPVNGCYAKMLLVPGGSPKQVMYDTIEELFAGIAHNQMQGGKNIYFAVASFNNKLSRKQANAMAVKSLFLDIDCGPGKPYATKREGLQALGKYVTDVGMPMPTIVDSGNGVHVYWVFTEEMDVSDWLVLASAFKRSIQHNNFQVDRTVPADSARVLRPIGTKNLKGGGTVKLLKQGPTTDPAFFQKKFIGTPAAPAATAATPQSINGIAIPAHIQGRVAKVTTLSQASEFAPAHPGVVAEKCDQIAWGVANQAKVSEPFWYAMLGVAAHCLDSEDTAKQWSSAHPDYSETATLAKMARWRASTTGPALCTKFREDRPKGCDKCKFKDKVATPAQIGVTSEAVEISADAPDAVAVEVPLPKYFKRVRRGDGKGFVRVIDQTDIDVCRFDIYPMSYGKDEALNYEVVRFKWKRPHVGWSDLVMRQALLNEGSVREFATALADQGIVLASSKLIGMFQEMLRSYMEELRKLRSLTNLYQSMGWKENNTQFLWGTTMMTRMTDGEVVDTNMAMSGTVQSSAQEMYHTSGSLERAVDATAVLERQQLFVHMFAIGVSLSAPLYRFTGIDGVIVHLFGETGAGKSLAQHWMQSMWGDPKLLHFNAQFTMNSLFSRLGFHCHLPMTIDETTRMTPENANNLTLMVSQGRDKYRLNKDSQERAPKTWSTPIGTSGNKPMSSILSSSGSELEAQLMRVMDIPTAAHPMFSKGPRPGELLYREVGTNFGWIGPLVLKEWMRLGEHELHRRIDLHKVKFAKKYNVKFRGQERFWQAALVLADLALETAIALGLLRFDHEPAMIHVLQQMNILRKAVVDAHRDEFDLLSEYLNDHARETVTIMYTGAGTGVMDINRRPMGSIHIRHDVYRADVRDPYTRGTMMIDKKHLRDWLVEHGGDIKSMMDTFSRAGIVVQVPNNKAVLSKGTGLKTPQLVVVAVNLDHPRLRGILDDADDASDSALQAKLTLVKP